MMEETREDGLGPVRRWSARRKQDVVLRLLSGESIDAVSREAGVEVYRLERWREKALSGMAEGLKSHPGDPLEGELNAAKRHIGELSMQNELLRTAVELRRPLARRRSRG